MATVFSGMRVADQGVSSSGQSTSASEYMIIQVISVNNSYYALSHTDSPGSAKTIMTNSYSTASPYSAHLIGPSCSITCTNVTYRYIKFSTTY